MMRTRWKGFYYDGVSAQRHEAEVTISSHGLIIKAVGQETEWPYGSITQSQGSYESEHVRLEKGDEALVVPERDFMDSLRTVAPSAASSFGKPEDARKLLLKLPLIAALVIAFCLAAYFWVIPGASDLIADNLPISLEERLGSAFADELRGVMPECKAQASSAPVEKIVNTLGSTAASPYKFKVYILKNPMVNALAAPGGHIVVFSGLLEKTESPEELAGVLAHEMEHVILRHSTRSMARSISTGALLSIVFGNTGMSGAVHAIGNMRYSREFEEEADRQGAELLLRAGIDPRGMVKFFEGLENGSDNGGGAVKKAATYLSSHPLTEDRARYLENMLEGRGIKAAPLMPGIDWEKTKKGCS